MSGTVDLDGEVEADSVPGLGELPQADQRSKLVTSSPIGVLAISIRLSGAEPSGNKYQRHFLSPVNILDYH